MASENVELVLGLAPPPGADLARMFRDEQSWQATASILAPALSDDFRCGFRGFLESDEDVAGGLEGLRATWIEWLAPWESYRSEVEDALDLGDRVLVLIRDYGRRAGDTQEIAHTSAAVWSVRDGRVARIVFYADRASALEAEGLGAPLSQPVAVVLAILALWNAGERGIEAIARYCDPAIELHSPFSSVVGEPYRGHAGIQQWARDVDEQFAEWRIAAERILPVGDRVIVTADVEARGRSSELTMRFAAAVVVEFAADGRIAGMRISTDVAEARRDVGLEP